MLGKHCFSKCFLGAQTRNHLLRKKMFPGTANRETFAYATMFLQNCLLFCWRITRQRSHFVAFELEIGHRISSLYPLVENGCLLCTIGQAAGQEMRTGFGRSDPLKEAQPQVNICSVCSIDHFGGVSKNHIYIHIYNDLLFLKVVA